MNYKIIERRAERNGFIKNAGINYLDRSSSLIKDLNNRNKITYLGIQHEDGVYTVLSLEALLFSTKKGTTHEINYSDFRELARYNFIEKGKTKNTSFLKIDEETKIWVKNSEMLIAILNLIILIDR